MCVCERERERERKTLRKTEAAARHARFIADLRDFSLEGAWYPAPTCTATKNLGLWSSASQAMEFYCLERERERERERKRVRVCISEDQAEEEEEERLVSYVTVSGNFLDEEKRRLNSAV